MSTDREAYIVAALRTPVGRRGGMLRNARPDDLLALCLRSVVATVPGLDVAEVGDVIVGCAIPEAEQGLNVARIALLLAGFPDTVPGMTLNRFCASGLQAIASAADRIRAGDAEVMIAGGVESMSMMPQLMGNRVAINPALFADAAHVAIAYGMGLTADRVARRWQVSRADQDAFALQSHEKALAAIRAGHFRGEIAACTVSRHLPDSAGTVHVRTQTFDTDEGPRADTSLAALARLRASFALDGTVTAGNSSQMSDGAAALLLMSRAALDRYGARPLARFVSYAVAGVAPEVMGIGPVAAVPRALTRAGCRQSDLGWVELNEAFAAQALAVMRALDFDPSVVNPCGGAIALGHPLGATGAIRAATLVHGLQRSGIARGLVTMCVGTGMGAAGVFERA